MRCITGKKCHCNVKRAKKSRDQLMHRKDWDRMSLDVYQCGECGMYHVGHNRDSWEARMGWKRLQTIVANEVD